MRNIFMCVTVCKSKVVASLNLLFKGVEVGRNREVVQCMVTQLLGDWKWHADTYLKTIFKLLEMAHG